MNILALDCSTAVLGIGVYRGTNQKSAQHPKHPYSSQEGHSPLPGVVQVHIDAGYRHAERIVQGVAYCLEEAGLDIDDIDLFACTGGPGSFTGLRIAAATIKGFSFSKQKPYVFVPTLDAYAWGFEQVSPVVVPLIDAKRGHFYFAVYKHGLRMKGPFDAPLSAVLQEVMGESQVLFTGPDADLIEHAVLDYPGYMVSPNHHTSAVHNVLILAEKIYHEQGPADEQAGPDYLRLSDAEEAQKNNATEN
ncbi:MAG TPA: tRNA (adenosine(37)-N6)-threonylcarbamoyltransferase complex dimerization subunit type 1 TsaB [Spirochaetia bacterium]|nr:tRNA (adenosine(37)-N6)-threonylcarbamoyltransferase complex dimerization subunit type 1 TsaB [Spirochaetales bacterium]HRS66317.1 tRNA (adenosine(37)-N6)-threonylcarbamoyltransferase complex dimerization subunit type 1 TsaB [Spirochaetia bacterium]HOT58866.1 tRNA (adenosine(37)-N6)-threonylcarbamoyltransferase complex dimerization subunit type 1 TsaB [Spirochaetales bacterium]HPD80485.1 tRNA (adenosine(37)-N6)-threonylcarbamoyltransferase complex dimerization subunit type 1 TsaB [Spirochaeta